MPLFFFKSGTLILAFFCITIIGAQEYHTTIFHTNQHTMPPLCLRSGFALGSLPEARTEREKEEGKEDVKSKN